MRLPTLALLATAIAIAGLTAAGAAFAAPPSTTGLGTSWPNTTDLSANPHYHVYRFERGGVRYVQVNDAAGNVRGAIGYVGGQVIDLPIGVDASRWTVVNDTSVPRTGEPVYRDELMSISITPQANGTARMMVMPECEGDPLECGKRLL